MLHAPPPVHGSGGSEERGPEGGYSQMNVLVQLIYATLKAYMTGAL